MPDYLKLKKEKDDEFESSGLGLRMDTDKKLQYLDKYFVTAMGDDGRMHIVPNFIHVTLPDTAIFSANILASLGSATERRVVTSENKKLDTAYIEDFQEFAFAASNDMRRRQGLPSLNVHTDEQMCIRGRGARRVLFRMKDGVLIPDITPWDTRFVRYDYGEKGLEWASYETKRTKGMIAAEYGIVITGKTGKVVDIWDTEHNEVWIDGKEVLSQAHPYDFTPVAIQVVSLGSMLADDDSMAHTGESMFFLIRDIVPELNRLVSIAQTINFRAAKNAYLWKSSTGEQADVPEHRDLTGFDSVTAAELTGGAEPVSIQDIQRSFIELNRIIEGRLQRGSLSNIDLGVLGNQPPSGVTLLQVKSDRDRVFRPRIDAKSLLNETTAEMLTKQCIQIGGSVELGVAGQSRTFQTSKLLGEYRTEYKYFVKSPELDAGAWTLYAAAGHSIPDRAKLREILQREDPEEDELWLSWERAAILSPAVRINRTVRDLVKLSDKGVEGAELEAELMSAEMGVNLKQMLAGDVSQMPQPEEEQEPKQVIPLLGQAQGTPSPRTEE